MLSKGKATAALITTSTSELAWMKHKHEHDNYTVDAYCKQSNIMYL